MKKQTLIKYLNAMIIKISISQLISLKLMIPQKMIGEKNFQMLFFLKNKNFSKMKISYLQTGPH